jgi:NAD(P)-dependent dehydrogenase (short-subunit alcohol dehydrogenase family)
MLKETIFGLEGRVALVTGGSKGLGKAMARILAEAGADIVVSSRNAEELEAALEEILRGTESRGHYVVGDLTRRQETVALAHSALEAMGRVDILINNAGVNHPEPIDEVTDEKWDRSLELNLSACMALTRALVPQMKQRRWGRIVYVSSIMGLASKEARNSYSATKSALIGLARANALDLAPFNITSNCIAPGPILTDLTRNLLSEEQKKLAADRTALGRWGQPSDLVGTALLLASEAGSFITGATILVDGGMLTKTW